MLLGIMGVLLIAEIGEHYRPASPPPKLSTSSSLFICGVSEFWYFIRTEHAIGPFGAIKCFLRFIGRDYDSGVGAYCISHYWRQ